MKLSILIVVTSAILIFMILNKKEESYEVKIEETIISLKTNTIEVYDYIKLSEIIDIFNPKNVINYIER